MPDIFINIDAAFLASYAQDISAIDAEVAARLLLCAQHLQGLDDAAHLQYQLGRRHMEAEIFARSNLLRNPEGEDEKGARIIARIEALNTTPVRRIPIGVRALDDKPHEFNGPVRKAAKPVERKVETKTKLNLDLLIDI